MWLLLKYLNNTFYVIYNIVLIIISLMNEYLYKNLPLYLFLPSIIEINYITETKSVSKLDLATLAKAS